MRYSRKDHMRSSPWLKRVLVPFWIVQILAMLVIIGLIAFVLYEAESYTLV